MPRRSTADSSWFRLNRMFFTGIFSRGMPPTHRAPFTRSMLTDRPLLSFPSVPVLSSSVQYPIKRARCGCQSTMVVLLNDAYARSKRRGMAMPVHTRIRSSPRSECRDVETSSNKQRPRT